MNAKLCQQLHDENREWRDEMLDCLGSILDHLRRIGEESFLDQNEARAALKTAIQQTESHAKAVGHLTDAWFHFNNISLMRAELWDRTQRVEVN